MRIIVVFICLLLFSCTKEIKIDQVDYQTKIVVDGWIENNGYAHVILTRSSPFLTEYDSASIRNTFLNYAKVTLSNGKGQSEVLTLSRQKDFFPPFIYKSTDIKGEIGETYELEVIYQNKIVSSVTTIPLLPDVKDVFSDNVSDTSMYIMAHIEDNSLSENYYYSQIFVKHIDTRFHPSGNPLQNDRLFNGKEHTFQVKRSNQPDPLNIHNIDGNRPLVRDEFAIDDTVLVKISQIDKEAYRVLNGIHIDHLNTTNPFAFIDQKTPTNINGGIGRWTGMASHTFLVTSKKPHN